MRIFSAAAALAAFYLAHPALAEPVGQPAALAAAPSDTPLTLPNGARFVAPKGWTIRKEAAAIILGAPEGNSHIAIADAGAFDSADAAVAAAWAIYRPGFSGDAKAARRPAREGWDETHSVRYQGPAGEARELFALALRKDGRWTVLINDLTEAVAAKRDGQLEIIFNSLLPEGYARESFAGRKAHRLDAARIAQLTDLIEIARRELDIPGVALGLIDNGEVVFAGGFGVRELGGRAPVDADTVFNVASNGKAFTTLMLAKLVEADKLAWDAPVAARWPAFKLGDENTTQAVKVRQLVCACTGMPRQDYEWLFEGDGAYASASSIMELLSAAQPTSEVGETFQYSNLMAAAAGYLGGHVFDPKRENGAAYDRAMQKLVFDPLAMTSTTAVRETRLPKNYAAGHAPDVDGVMRVAGQGLNLASISTRPSGNHWSNVNDMLRYVRLELDKGRLANGRRFIDEETLLARREPQVATGLNEYYGMGLKIDRQWGVTVIHHGGSASGYRTDMMWLPDQGVGAVILTNSDTGSLLRSAFRRRLQEVLFDGAPKAVADIQQFAPRQRASIAETRAGLTVPADAEAVLALASLYRSDSLGALEVVNIDGAIYFDFSGWRTEVATRRGEDGAVTFVTISPGVDGFEFEPVAGADGARSLFIRDAQHEYAFVAE